MRKILVAIIHIYRKLTCYLWSSIFKFQCISTEHNIVCNSRCNIGGGARVFLKDHFHSNGLSIGGFGDIHIGKYFHSGSNCKIMLGSHDYDKGDAIPYGKQYDRKNVEVGDFVWFGSDVTICGNVKIGNGAIIAMGSVVVKDVPDFAIVGGNPAKIIKYRDARHFNKLLKEKKFH